MKQPIDYDSWLNLGPGGPNDDESIEDFTEEEEADQLRAAEQAQLDRQMEDYDAKRG